MLINRCVTEKIKEDIKKLWKQMNMKTKSPNTMGHSKISSKRKIYSDISLPQERRKISNMQPSFTLKGI